MIKRAPEGSAIGSDFETLADSELVNNETPPWVASGRGTAYTETGRQALSLIARVLARRGIGEILVPSYLCESMVAPFVRLGWRVTTLPMSEALRLNGPERIEAQLQDGTNRAVLLATYFGRLPNEGHIQLARRAHEAGFVVIEDETHRVLTPGGVNADITFGSLRKVLPVADGAYLQGDPELFEEVEKLVTGDSGRWSAMDDKRAHLDALDEQGYRAVFVAANTVLDNPDRERRASDRTMGTLPRLPYFALARIRRENARALRAVLAQLGIAPLDGDDGGAPSHLVVSVDRPTEAQRKLAEARIYCPIHWPPVPGFPSGTGWRNDLLSLPVDHRYTAVDMERVARTLQGVMLS